MSKTTYRFLKQGEIIEAGDEFKNLFTGDWHPSLAAGYAVCGPVDTYRRKVAAPVEVGEGYRALEVGEVVQHGDDYWYGNRYGNRQWLAIGVVSADVRVRPGQQYRRKLPEVWKGKAVEPGTGYRLLKPGEILEEGDEYRAGAQWLTTLIAGEGLRKDASTPYRRKVASGLTIGEVKAENYVTPVLHKREVLTGSELWALVYDGKVCTSAQTYQALSDAITARNGKDIAWHLANGFRVARVRQSFTIEQELKAGGAK